MLDICAKYLVYLRTLTWNVFWSRTLSNQQNCTPSDNEKDSSLIPSSSLSADAVTAAKMSSDAIKLEIAKNRESLHQVPSECI